MDQSSKKSGESQEKPQLCFVGHMVGRHAGHVTTQGQILCDLFRVAGYQVVCVSARLKRLERLVDVVSTLLRRARNIEIQVIEVYGGASFILEDVASWLGRLFGHRVVLWVHGGAMGEFMARHPRWTRRVFNRADAIIVPSEFLARILDRHGFHVRVIPNVIDLPTYNYRHRQTVRPHLFWMRQFHPIWNPMMALRTLARLRLTTPQATLVMAGPDRGFESDVREMAKELGVSDAVRFSGFLDMQGKIREGEAADIYINTNRIDNMPVAVLEACAMGLPVVSTNVGGLPDLLADGETALLVPDDNDEAMAAAISSLLGGVGLAARLSANGRQLAERSSWEQVRPQWERIFGDLLGRSSSRGRNGRI